MINLLPKLAINNKSVLENSKTVGCYCCCKIFDAKEVKNFTDNGQTGVCPFCLGDCLIGDSCGIAIEESYLKKAKAFWFEG